MSLHRSLGMFLYSTFSLQISAVFLFLFRSRPSTASHGSMTLLNPNLVCIYIVLHPNEQDEFYIFRLSDLQQHTLDVYKGRKRPKNPTSTHCAVFPRHLQPFRDNWKLIEQSFNV